jgi:uncharacterized membrane protein YphA (DoxX/SURF4 family)
MSSLETERPVRASAPTRSESGAETAFSVGRSFLGIAVLASGVLQLVTGELVRLVPTAAAGGGRSPSLLPYVVGLVLVAAGCAIATDRRARLAAAVLAGLIAVSLLLVQLPRIAGNPWVGYVWTNPLKAVALAASGGLVAAGSRAGGASPGTHRIASLEALGVFCLAFFLLVAGVQHFVYADFVTALVPSWIPGQRLWTYFTGVALFAGGAGMLIPRTSRLAATLSAAMIFLWVLLLHIPRAVAGPDHANETAGVFEALAMSGIALMIAGTRRRRTPSRR